MTAFAVATNGIGGTTNFEVIPRWMGPFTFADYALQPTSAMQPGEQSGDGPYFFVKVPTSDAALATVRNPLAPFASHWVAVRGRFGDPAAKTCHAGTVYGGSAPSAAEMVRTCQEVFVLTSASTASSPATSTDPAGPASASDPTAPPAVLLWFAGGVPAGLSALVLSWRWRSRRLKPAAR